MCIMTPRCFKVTFRSCLKNIHEKVAPEQWRSPEALRELLLRKPQVLDLSGSSGSFFFHCFFGVRCELRNIYRYFFCPGDFLGKVSFRFQPFLIMKLWPWRVFKKRCALRISVGFNESLGLRMKGLLESCLMFDLWYGWQGTPRVGFFQFERMSLPVSCGCIFSPGHMVPPWRDENTNSNFDGWMFLSGAGPPYFMPLSNTITRYHFPLKWRSTPTRKWRVKSPCIACCKNWCGDFPFQFNSVAKNGKIRKHVFLQLSGRRKWFQDFSLGGGGLQSIPALEMVPRISSEF